MVFAGRNEYRIAFAYGYVSARRLRDALPGEDVHALLEGKMTVRIPWPVTRASHRDFNESQCHRFRTQDTGYEFQ
ncbi:MAG: hypothetical protein OEY08_12365 [Gammaproteobacteria bacterium]|nr:hypothetical protein [Gammaproteobacteria bacterium]